MSFDLIHEKYANLDYLLQELVFWNRKPEPKSCVNCKLFTFEKKYCNKWKCFVPKEGIIEGCESYVQDTDWYYRIEPNKRQLVPEILADLSSKKNQTELMNHLAEYQNRQGDL